MGNLVKFGCPICTSPHLKEENGKLYCKSCDKWFEKDVETNEERDARNLYLSRLDSAEKLLRMSPPRFDDAEDEFRDFIKHYPDHCDGYWGLVRARHGIKYENDVTGKTVPSCYKSSYKDFRRDSDFMKALELAENDFIYDGLQDQAKLIAGICEEWRKEAGKYNYDIFISFKGKNEELKISDEDQREMNDLYDFLKDEGYSVFFSPRSMHKHTGMYYDAYIFSALQSAKVMIVYGSNPEYFTSTWVQNEWTRFLRMVDNGEKKMGSCIVVYNGFNPYELPHDLRRIQAVDASQKRYYIDILNCVKNILAEEKKVDTNEELMQKNEELMRKFEELTRQNEENQKRQEELQKSLEEERKKNSIKQEEQEPTATLTGEKNAPKAPSEVTPKEEPKKPEIDPDFEIVDGCLKKYKGNKAEVIIPDGVTSIGDEVFSFCSSLASVVIPDSVTSIGKYAFAACSSLTSITVDSNNPKYMSIDGNLYSKNEKTLIQYAIGKKGTSFTIPNSVTSIGKGAFFNYRNLTNIVIPDSVTSIGKCAFSGCKSLTSVVIPNSVTSIGINVFDGCMSLTSIVIPNSVTSICAETFLRCSSLTSVVIPNSVTSIGKNAFKGCEKLTIKVHSLDQVKKWKDGWNPDNRPVQVIQKAKQPEINPDFEIVDGCLKKYKGNKEKVVIPDGVTSIGEKAFSNCKSLTSVVIPNSVTSVGNEAFYDCDGLVSVTIPDSVTSIGERAFWWCSSITSVVIPNSVTSVGNEAFEYCKSLTSVVIPDSVTSIGKGAFEYCKSLTRITVDSNNPKYMSIDGNLYSKDRKTLIQYAIGKKDTSFTIPNSVEFIGKGAFYDCDSLVSVTIPDSVTSIGSKAFHNTAYCNNKSNWIDNVLYIGNHLIEAKDTFSGKYVIKDTTITIAANAFSDCSSLTNVVIPDSVTSIGEEAFSGCSSLASVVIPGSVISIGSRAFFDCDSLTSITVDSNNPKYMSIDGNLYSKDGKTLIQYAIGKKGTSFTIPNSVEFIGEGAFYDCNNLTMVVIPDSVTSIGDDAFLDCYDLTRITVDSNNPNYMSIDDNLYSKDGKTLIQYAIGKKGTSFTIPNSVEFIGEGAFEYCDSLTSVVIPNSVTSVGEGAFYHSDSLTSVVIPNSVTSIGDMAFDGCNSLISIVIPNSVTSIGRWAFDGCKNLTIFVHSLDQLKKWADGWNPDNRPVQVIEQAKKPEVNPDFEIVDSCLKKYKGKKAEVIIPDGVTSIGDSAFYYCSSLTSVVIPNSVEFIGDNAFSFCSSLTSVVIPNSVTSIGESAFYYCPSLTSVVIPNSVTSIGKCAFSGCSSLKSATIPNSVTSIGDSVFAHCLNLKSVNIPDNITYIGDHAFYRCYNLESVTIPDSVEFIGNCAFADCSDLKSVTIPNSVTEFGNLAFSGCSSLTSVTISDSVTAIGISAFEGCSRLASVTIPNSVTSIGARAFFGCKKLTIKVHSLDQVKKWADGWNPNNRPVQVIEQEKKGEDNIYKSELLRRLFSKKNQ